MPYCFIDSYGNGYFDASDEINELRVIFRPFEEYEITPAIAYVTYFILQLCQNKWYRRVQRKNAQPQCISNWFDGKPVAESTKAVAWNTYILIPYPS